MSNDWDKLWTISRASTIDALTDASADAFKALGFRASFYVGIVTADPHVGRIFTAVGLSEEWQELYRSRLFLDDPLPSICLSHASAFRWSAAHELAHLTPAQSEYLELLSQQLKSDGIAVPCFAARARCGLIGVGGAESENAWDNKNVLKVQLTAQLSFHRFCEVVHVGGKPIPQLSARQLEVLELIAEGKSNSVIGDILTISKLTVNTYVSRIFDKLGVRDRTTAAVRALSLGLIRPPDRSEAEVADLRERALGRS